MMDKCLGYMLDVGVVQYILDGQILAASDAIKYLVTSNFSVPEASAYLISLFREMEAFRQAGGQ